MANGHLGAFPRFPMATAAGWVSGWAVAHIVNHLFPQYSRIILRYGSGIVYEGKNSRGEPVAIKKPRVTTSVAHTMLRHEACALILLAPHKGFPRAHAWGRSQWFEYLVMDILGPSLSDMLRMQGGRFNVSSVLLLTIQMVRLPRVLEWQCWKYTAWNSRTLTLTARRSLWHQTRQSPFWQPLRRLYGRATTSNRLRFLSLLSRSCFERSLPMS